MGVQQRPPTDAIRKGESSMIIGSGDRSYYRLISKRELIEEAKYAPSAELAIVLAERLEATIHKQNKEEDKK
jgi:hypothetical protein